MAIRAQGNQIVFAVVAQMASCLDVMYLQVRPTPTALASPTFTPQDLLAQRPIGLGHESQLGLSCRSILLDAPLSESGEQPSKSLDSISIETRCRYFVMKTKCTCIAKIQCLPWQVS